jgi:hypothetical protein
MIRVFVLACLNLLLLSATAQTFYPAAEIPKSLLPYASAVVRNMEMTTEVKDLNTTVNHHKVAVTILNKNGEDNADMVIWYDKGRRIKFIKGRVYDEYGKPTAKFSEKDFLDFSAGDGFSMFVDTRLKHYKPSVMTYPYTLEYEYEVQSRQTLNFEDWNPNGNTGTAVQHSVYKFICPPDFAMRYKEMNYAGKLDIGTTPAGQKAYTWEANNLLALRDEPYSPRPDTYETVVKIVPEKFIYEGYSGSFTNWNDLGKWIYDKLLAGRAALPPTTIAEMHSLTDTIKDVKLKAKAIYEYMQRKSRYVSIQVGIGGFQPFSATEVDKLSYGDCKGLVNYTQALLKAVNIDSYYCVVNAGSMKKSLFPDFASMTQANHIILCLPLKGDTTWMECTNKDIPFGYLGDFTDDRWVLACTSDGGKLMHTPKYSTADSKQIRKALLTLKDDGELSGNMTTTFEGWQYENRPNVPGENSDEIKNAKERYAINNLEIEKLLLKPVKTQQPLNHEEMQFTARDYAASSSGRLFFMANLANRYTSVPREVRNRTTDVYINRGYTDVDEIVYQIPAGYRLDSAPLLVNIQKPFGSFTATATLNDKNQVVYKRKLEVKDGTYAKSAYEDLVNFYQRVADADSYKVALVKN